MRAFQNFQKKDGLRDQLRVICPEPKKQIEKYPDSEEEGLAIVWDENEDYGQNFYICLTVKAKDAVVEKFAALAEAAAAPGATGEGGGEGGEGGGGADDGPLEEYKPPEAKEWVSQGSEAEIAEEAAVATRELVSVAYERKRSEFGRAPPGKKFYDRDALDDEDPEAARANECKQFTDPNFHELVSDETSDPTDSKTESKKTDSKTDSAAPPRWRAKIERREAHVGVQVSVATSETDSQTRWFRPVNKHLQYAPITMGDRDRHDVVSSEAMRDFLVAVRERCDLALQQNDTIDILQDDFGSLTAEETAVGGGADGDMRELMSFTHLEYCAGKMHPTIVWQPGVKGVVAVSLAQRADCDQRAAELEVKPIGNGPSVLLWSFSDPIHPQYVLEAPGDVLAFRFHPTRPATVIGGLSDGTVVVWNLTQAKFEWEKARSLAVDEKLEGAANTITAKPVALSAVVLSHKRAVTDLVWLPPTIEVDEKGRIARKEDEKGTTQQFCTLAADGQLLFWDLREAAEAAPPAVRQAVAAGGGVAAARARRGSISAAEKQRKKEGWGPTYAQPILGPKPPAGSRRGPELAARRLLAPLDVPPTPESEGEGAPPPSKPPRVYAVTEEGEFFSCDIGTPSTSNDTHPRGVRMDSILPAHYGPVTALLPSPFAKDVFLSVGDWTFNLWRKGIDAPLFVSPFATAMITCGAWSPLRPGVIFIGRADGSIDVWDLNFRTSEPSMTNTMDGSGTAVTSMQFQADGQLLAVGDHLGAVHIMAVPLSFRREAYNETANTLRFFEREARRKTSADEEPGDGEAEAAEDDGAAAAKAAGGDAIPAKTEKEIMREIKDQAKRLGVDLKGITEREEMLAKLEVARFEAEFKAIEEKFKEDMDIDQPKD